MQKHWCRPGYAHAIDGPESSDLKGIISVEPSGHFSPHLMRMMGGSLYMKSFLKSITFDHFSAPLFSSIYRLNKISRLRIISGESLVRVTRLS